MNEYVRALLIRLGVFTVCLGLLLIFRSKKPRVTVSFEEEDVEDMVTDSGVEGIRLPEVSPPAYVPPLPYI